MTHRGEAGPRGRHRVGNVGPIRVRSTRDPGRPTRFSAEALRRRQPRRVYIRRRVIAAGSGIVVLLALGAAILTAGSSLVTAVSGLGADDASPESSTAGPGSARGGDDPFRREGWTARENARPGSMEWGIEDSDEIHDQIRGFAGVTSIDRQGSVDLYVSTVSPTFSVTAFRMGYYGGRGAREVWSREGIAGEQQGEAVLDPQTRMAVAPWSPSVTVEVGRDWPPGVYLFRLATPDGGASLIPLTVRDDDSTAPLLIQSSVTTWQAYNDWGGASLYAGGPDGDPALRADVVSFDRPYTGNGTGEFFGREWELIYFAEQLGIDVTYWTDIDLHEQPERAQQHRAVISLGHDEYYTVTMRKGLEQARDAGTNVAFLGANAAYRRIRLEDSDIGPNRREVNYRIAANDPLYGVDDERVTTSFRDPPAADPESTLIGNFYECNPVAGDMVIVEPDAWIFEGTGLEEGSVLPGIVGNEYDRVTPEVPTPDNIEVFAHSPVDCKGVASYADMTYYTADSGAGVFATGTLWWIRPHLVTECPTEDPDLVPHCLVQQVTENLLRTFARGPAGEEHPSETNLAELGITAGYVDPVPG